ncbi:U3 small nucleolar RNA-associated protein 22 [Golovinomyces cichoracearum]|uniref:U3 small nucleolar RNA-associated protein 22 n=1 Tax=Golovinomyces cichoracearum TaxID=62708 RepID=A0A420HL64_9PEZI|nr:U3 small nucleolar RNA-associated protein 22 [Golovinomyces cichoracearum]
MSLSPSAPKKRKLDPLNDVPPRLKSPISNSEVRRKPTSRPERSLAKDIVLHPHDALESISCHGGEYGSRLFKLQVDELLAEVKLSHEKKLKGVDDTLKKLKIMIENIEPREPLSTDDLSQIAEASKSLQDEHITIPYPDPKPNENIAYKISYDKPASINIVGSYILKTMIKSRSPPSIDLIVVMPNSIFQKKDYLNYRYFYKRAYYLACIAAGLKSSAEQEFAFRYENLHGNDLHPIIVATPNVKTSAHEIRIIPTAGKDLFPLTKLRLNKNSLRSKIESLVEVEIVKPTLFYNSSLSSDCNVESYLNILHVTSKSSQGFRDACILGRIWLQQRGFDGSICGGGFGHFEWASLTALLLRGGGPKDKAILSYGYSSFQLFKSFLQFLSTGNLMSKPFTLHSTNISVQESGTPIFYDSPREHNILYKMSPWSYKLLQIEAKTTLDMLNDDKYDHFDSTFIVKTTLPLLKFDCVFSISQPPEKPDQNFADHYSNTKRFSRRLYSVLEEGLLDRVRVIHIKENRPGAWRINSKVTNVQNDSLNVSVIFDPTKISRLVDHGPSVEEKEKAAKFRKFWGQKAELRRFKDGSIMESLVWPAGSTKSIFETIVKYLVDRHWDSETAKSIAFMGGDGIERLLPDLEYDMKRFEALKDAFKSLENQIRGLEGLPLQLKQLSPLDSQLRYSSIESPFFGPGRPMLDPASVLLEFEGSGRWPDDLVAIQRAKVAFLLRIGSLLEKADESIKARLGLENESQVFQNCAFLDVIYQHGPAFRLRIYIDREHTLLQQRMKDKSTKKSSCDDAAYALWVYKRNFIQLPLLTQSISTHCTRFPLLSGAIRLVKLWFNRHMLCRHFSDEVIELIVARTFLHPYPWLPPSSLIAAFLRTLVFLSKWDWSLNPLIVDFTSTMNRTQFNLINTQLEAWRKIDPLLNRTVLLVASNHDVTGIAFSAQNPSKLIAARMTALARSANKVIKDLGYMLDVNSLFITSTAEYDFLIHLSDDFTSLKKEDKTSQIKHKNFEVQSEKYIEKVGYQPVQLYLAELENLYSNNIVFFHENYTGSVIAGLWNPQSLSPRSFKVNLSYSTQVLEKDNPTQDQVFINQNSILSEISRLGCNMVSRIEIQKH